MTYPFNPGDIVRDIDGDEARVVDIYEDIEDGLTMTLDYGFKGDGGAVLEQWEHGYVVPDDFTLVRSASAQTAERDDDAEEAKLVLAADHGLRVKFVYTGDAGHRQGAEVRLEPDSTWYGDSTLYVGGESFDQNGESEGYRQFRLDRIQGKVVVR